MDVRWSSVGHHRLMAVVVAGLLVGSAAGCGSEPASPVAFPAASGAPAGQQDAGSEFGSDIGRQLDDAIRDGVSPSARPPFTIPGSGPPGLGVPVPTTAVPPATVPSTAVPPIGDPVPTIPAAPAGSSGNGLMAALLAVLVVLVVAAGGFAILRTLRDRAPGTVPHRPYTPPASAPPTPSSAPPPSWTAPPPRPAPEPPRPSPRPDEEVLDGVLRQVAAAAPGAAVREQIERLLGGGQTSRRELVDACVRYRDQLAERDPRLGTELLDALAAAGVHEVRAEGERFDPDRHEVVDTVDTDDAQRHDHVARTLAPGYLDRGQLLRLPQVCLYRARSEGAVP